MVIPMWVWILAGLVLLVLLFVLLGHPISVNVK